MRLGVDAALVADELVPGDVEVSDGRVAAVALPPPGTGLLAAPGFVDLQVNGFAGVDLLAADGDGVRHAARALLATGVTAWQPTLITADPADTARAGAAVAAPWAPGTQVRGRRSSDCTSRAPSSPPTAWEPTRPAIAATRIWRSSTACSGSGR